MVDKVLHLNEALENVGLINHTLYQDRGPLCVRVPITGDDDGEFKPALYVFLDRDDDSPEELADKRGWRWQVTLGGYDDDTFLAGLSEDIRMEILERPWLSESEKTVAETVFKLSVLLQNGANKLI